MFELLTDESKQWIGLLAGTIHLLAFGPYILAVLRKKVSPSYVSWWTWTIVALLAAIFYEESAESLFASAIAWTMVIGTGITSVLISIKGSKGEWGKEDVYCVIGIATTLVVWWVFRSAQAGLFLMIAVDAIGSVPTIKKSYLDPGSESSLGWGLGSLATIVNLPAVHWTIIDASWPLYIFFMMNAIFIALLLGRRAQKLRAGT